MKALITGCNGQDGSYLSELLLDKEYTVYGLIRRTSTNNLANLNNCLSNPNFKLIEGDVTDSVSMSGIIGDIKPDEIYHLACQSHVGTSFKQPHYTINSVLTGTLNVLEAVKNLSPKTKIYHAGTSEQFGKNYSFDIHTDRKVQNLSTPFNPNSPYAIAKTAAFQLVTSYREAYGLFAVNGILGNHESERRGENFVTRKITKWIGQFVSLNRTEKLKLGNLSAYRDWGYAKDYVVAMHKMLQQKEPTDHIIATGETYTVKDFLDASFTYMGLKWEDYVIIDKELYRPNEVPYLCLDSTQSRRVLDWKPTVSFDDLVKLMVNHDVQKAQKK